MIPYLYICVEFSKTALSLPKSLMMFKLHRTKGRIFVHRVMKFDGVVTYIGILSYILEQLSRVFFNVEERRGGAVLTIVILSETKNLIVNKILHFVQDNSSQKPSLRFFATLA